MEQLYVLEIRLAASVISGQQWNLRDLGVCTNVKIGQRGALLTSVILGRL